MYIKGKCREIAYILALGSCLLFVLLLFVLQIYESMNALDAVITFSIIFTPFVMSYNKL